MNRAEYMKELEYLLQDVADEEKEEALQYYEDYFDDAGVENEAQVIAELGRPEKVAAIIRDGVRNGYENQDAEYTEAGYRNDRFRDPRYDVIRPEKRAGAGEGAQRYADAPYRETEEQGSTENRKEDAQRRTEPSYPRRNWLKPVLWIGIIFAAIFALPLIFGAGLAVFGIVLAAVCAVGGIALAVILSAVVFLVCGVFFIGLGIAKAFALPVAGVMFGGAGLFLLGGGMLFLWLSVLICGKAIPGAFHMIGNFFHFLGKKLKRGGREA